MSNFAYEVGKRRLVVRAAVPSAQSVVSVKLPPPTPLIRFDFPVRSPTVPEDRFGIRSVFASLAYGLASRPCRPR